MGVNMVGYCIVDEEAAIEASKQEIIRRYYQALVDVKREKVAPTAVTKIELLMNEGRCDTGRPQGPECRTEKGRRDRRAGHGYGAA